MPTPLTKERRDKIQARVRTDCGCLHCEDKGDLLREIERLETENRRLRLLIPMTMEEAEEAMANATPVPMDDAEIDRILENIRRREEAIKYGPEKSE